MDVNTLSAMENVINWAKDGATCQLEVVGSVKWSADVPVPVLVRTVVLTLKQC